MATTGCIRRDAHAAREYARDGCTCAAVDLWRLVRRGNRRRGVSYPRRRCLPSRIAIDPDARKELVTGATRRLRKAVAADRLAFRCARAVEWSRRRCPQRWFCGRPLDRCGARTGELKTARSDRRRVLPYARRVGARSGARRRFCGPGSRTTDADAFEHAAGRMGWLCAMY